MQVGFDFWNFTKHFNTTRFLFFDRTSWKFNLNFNDTSELKFKNKKISLNVVAKVCLNPHFKKNFVFDDFWLEKGDIWKCSTVSAKIYLVGNGGHKVLFWTFWGKNMGFFWGEVVTKTKKINLLLPKSVLPVHLRMMSRIYIYNI